MTIAESTKDIALSIAGALIDAGIPIFRAWPNEHSRTGYGMPKGWQHTQPNRAVLERMQPGDALCMVTGRGVDVIDFDPRSGGTGWPEDIARPIVYGAAATPSDGAHWYVGAIGVASKNAWRPGIDVKSGTAGANANGSNGRGYVFLPPTERLSKQTGEPVAYRWVKPLDLAAISTRSADSSLCDIAEDIRVGRESSVAGARGLTGRLAEFARGAPQTPSVAERAIRRELTALAEWSPSAKDGYRDVLLRAAFILGGYVGSGVLDEDTAAERLRGAVCAVWPEPDGDDELWIEQGLTDGTARPFLVSDGSQNGHVPAYGEGLAAAGDIQGTQELKPEPRPVFDPVCDGSDHEIAQAVLEFVHPAFRPALDTGGWLARGSQRWEELNETASSGVVASVIPAMPIGNPDLPSAKADYTREHWQASRRTRFTTQRTFSGIVSRVRALTSVPNRWMVRVGELDAEPEILWAGGAAWDLRASLREPVRADLDPGTPHLHTARVVPDAEAPTPRWDAFLATVWPDPAVRGWAVRVLSIALAGYPDAALPVIYGSERSGKSSVAALLADLLGTYGAAADARLLGGHDGHASIVYALKGLRMAFIDEGPKRGQLAAERLKQITGGAPLTGNAMRQNPITWNPTHTLVMTANPDAEPQVTDPALRARLRIIPANAQEHDVRPARRALAAAWGREAPGVLAMFMRECAAWLEAPETAGNAVAPGEAAGLVQELVENQSPVLAWLAACTRPDEAGTPSRELYHAFAGWHDAHALFRKAAIPTETAWGRAMSDAGYPPFHTREGKRRSLVIDARDGFTRYVTGSDGFGGKPVTPENPSSTSVSTTSVTGVTGYTTHTHKSPIHIGGSGVPLGVWGEPDPTKTRQTRHTWHLTSENTEKNPSPNASQPGTTRHEMGGSATLGEAETGGQPPLFDGASSNVANSDEKTEKMGGQNGAPPAKPKKKPSAEVVAKRDARTAARRLERVAAAAGPVIGLPARVRRSGAAVALSREHAAVAVRQIIMTLGGIGLDAESTGYPMGHPEYRVRTFQLGDDETAVVFDAADAPQLATVAELLAEAPVIYAHSATADIGPAAWLELIDYAEGYAKVHDTASRSQLADPTTGGGEPGLKSAAPAILGERAVCPAADAGRKKLFSAGGWLTDTDELTPLERSGWAACDYTRETMIRYAASDVLDCVAIAKTLPEVDHSVWARECAVSRVTSRSAFTGFELDPAVVTEQIELREPLIAAAVDGGKAHGVDLSATDRDRQLSRALAGMGVPLPATKTGVSVAKDVLEPHAGREDEAGDLIRHRLDYQRENQRLSTYLYPWRMQIQHGDGRVRPTIYTLGADTGRMSSRDPNVQNIPKAGGMREAILAPQGYVFVSADFKNVEVRGMAVLSEDDHLKRLILDGLDLHTLVATQVFGDPPTEKQRHTAKHGVNFPYLYGAGVQRMALSSGLDEATVRTLIDTLRGIAPGLARWGDGLRSAVKQGYRGYPTYSGRTIHLPGNEPHKAVNYAVQGTCRELLVDALLRWDAGSFGGGVIIPVHDEILAVVPEHQAQDAGACLLDCMTMQLGDMPILGDLAEPSRCWRSKS